MSLPSESWWSPFHLSDPFLAESHLSSSATESWLVIFSWSDGFAFSLQAPLYPTKAKLFPGSTFVIGYDTAIRLVDGKYYGGDDAALLQIAAMKQSVSACA